MRETRLQRLRGEPDNLCQRHMRELQQTPQVASLPLSRCSTPYSTWLTNQSAIEQQSAIPRYGNAIVIGSSLTNSDAETLARFAYSQPRDYPVRMHRAFAFCLATAAKAVPDGPD